MPRILAREESRVSPFVRLVQKSVDFEDGKPPQIYHFLAQAPYVHVLARTPSGRIPIVRQFRPCLEVNTLEFPGGTVDAGQDPATAARMEVEEETGHRVLNLYHLQTLYPDTGRLEFESHMFYAQITEEPVQAVQETGLSLRYVDGGQLRELMRSGEFCHQMHWALYAGALLLGLAV